MDKFPGASYNDSVIIPVNGRRAPALERSKICVLLIELTNTFYAGVIGRCLRNWAYQDKELRDHFEIKIAVFNYKDQEDAAVEAILRSRPAIIGISCYIWSISRIRRIASKVKERLPTVKIVLGGPEVMHEPRKTLVENPAVDWVACAEEGEEVFRWLLRGHVLEKRPVDEVPGLAWRDGEGGVRVNPAPKFIDMETVPLVYAGQEPVEATRKIAVLELSRGCPFTCTFCDWGDRQMRQISLSRIEAEFSALARQVERVALADADILTNRKKGPGILRAFVKAARGTECRLGFNTNPTFLSPEIIDVIAESPSRFLIGMGVQTINQEVLKRIERPLRLERVEANLRELRRRAPDLLCRIQMIIGLPGDDFEGVRSSMDWALRVWPEGLLAFPLLVLPGSPLHKEAQGRGLRYSPLPMYQIEETPDMSRDDIARAFELAAYSRFMSFPSYRDAVLGGSDAKTPLSAIASLERWMNFLKKNGHPLIDEETARHPMQAIERFVENKSLVAATTYLTAKFASTARENPCGLMGQR